MITELEIFNMALGQLGITRVSNLTDSTDKRVQAYQMYYEQALRFVLADLQLSFSLKIDPLSLLSDQIVPGWDYAYQLPGDCVMVQGVMDEDGTRETEWGIRRIGSISDTVVCTNLVSAYIEFVQAVGETSVFPPQFVEVLKYKLAMDMAVFLTSDNGKLAANKQLFDSAKMDATIIDNRQSDQILPDDSTYTDSRA